MTVEIYTLHATFVRWVSKESKKVTLITKLATCEIRWCQNVPRVNIFSLSLRKQFTRCQNRISQGWKMINIHLSTKTTLLLFEVERKMERVERVDEVAATTQKDKW